MRRLAHEGGTRPKLEIIRDAAIEVRKPTMFGELIIAIVYLPILALQGTEGKLFRPMALTVIFALAGSLVLSLTRDAGAGRDGPERPAPGEGSLADPLDQAALSAGARRCSSAIRSRRWSLALALVGASVPIALNLGGEFMPRLNEGDLLIEAVRIPSASLEGAVAASTQIENLLKTIPEVRLVYCKTGRPEIANDVMGVHQTDVWTMLKPQDEWRPGLTRDDLIEEMDKLLSEHVPGVKFGFSQPIEMRVNELVAGVKSDVAALIYGPDLKVLRAGCRWRSSACWTRSRGARHQEPDRGPAADAPDQGPPRPAGRATGSRRPTCSTRWPRWGARRSAPSSRKTSGIRCSVRLPEVVAERPREDRLDPDRRPPGPADPAQGPRRHRRRGRPQRGRARERPAPGGRRRQCPRPRHRQLRRRGPGRDRRDSS